VESLRAVSVGHAEWSLMAPEFHDLSYRQCPSFVAEAARSNGAVPEFLSIVAGDALVGLCAIRVKKLPGLPLGVAYVSHGPLTMRNAPFSGGRYADCLSALARHYVQDRKLLLRIVPPYAASLNPAEVTQDIAAARFQRLDQFAHPTILLGVDRDLEQIRRALDGRWRNKLAQAERLAFQIVETNQPDDFRIMEPMLRDLEETKNFRSGRDLPFFERLQRSAQKYERLTLHLARFEGRVLSAHLSSFAGDTVVSLLAATNKEGRRLKVSHRMQWRMVEDAARAGKRWYDLGGIDPVENPGVYSFKKGMNGVEIAELGTFERAPNFAMGRTVAFVERLYSGLRRA
jgi:CelD/BcsL family acetyltransferase involved in cellulose biosynthesis